MGRGREWVGRTGREGGREGSWERGGGTLGEERGEGSWEREGERGVERWEGCGEKGGTGWLRGGGVGSINHEVYHSTH